MTHEDQTGLDNQVFIDIPPERGEFPVLIHVVVRCNNGKRPGTSRQVYPEAGEFISREGPVGVVNSHKIKIPDRAHIIRFRLSRI